MKIMINIITIMFGITILFTGCAKKADEYNKPALYWYGKMVKSISNGDLEGADSYYSSLQGEHISSPLLQEATMILAIAHMHYEEYLMSEHFLNDYIKRYATVNEKEFADFLKIKSIYKALPNPRRDQVLMVNAINSAKKFKRTYPYSMYTGIVDTMLTRLQIAEAVLNETIASLYDRLDKPKSAEYYRSINPQSWIDFETVELANSAWYRSSFEGDGSDSWYEFMIPDTQSVVSRNKIHEDEVVTEQDVEDSKSPWYSNWYNDLLSNEKEMKKEKFDDISEDSSEHSSEQLPLD